MSVLRPFANAGGHTTFDNAILDYIMPRCKPNSWKVICATLRKTIGWIDPDSPTGRKQADKISMSQYHKLTGISSRQTLVSSIEDCLENGYITRQKSGKSFTYSLNRQYEIRTDIGTEIVPMIGTEIVHTKESIKESKDMTGEKTARHPAIDIYRDEAHTFPPKSWWSDIADTVGSDEKSLTLFRSVIHAYIGNGWNKRNIRAMLDYYSRGQIPQTKANGDKPEKIIDTSDALTPAEAERLFNPRV
jgi:hypothetical protein